MRLGRVTFNPLKHVDLIGTVILLVLLLLSIGGWMMCGFAKPVPVNFAGRARVCCRRRGQNRPGTVILVVIAGLLPHGLYGLRSTFMPGRGGVCKTPREKDLVL